MAPPVHEAVEGLDRITRLEIGGMRAIADLTLDTLDARDQVLQALFGNDDALRRLYETTELGFQEVADFAAQFLKPLGA